MKERVSCEEGGGRKGTRREGREERAGVVLGGGRGALPPQLFLCGIIMKIIPEIFMCIDGWKGFCGENLVTRRRGNDPLSNLDFLTGHVGPARVGHGTGLTGWNP